VVSLRGFEVFRSDLDESFDQVVLVLDRSGKFALDQLIWLLGSGFACKVRSRRRLKLFCGAVWLACVGSCPREIF
jgi:hypothetical protein